MSLLDLTVEAGMPDDVMGELIDCKNIVYVPRQDGFLVNMVNEGFDEELCGMSTDFAIQMKEVTLAAV